MVRRGTIQQRFWTKLGAALAAAGALAITAPAQTAPGTADDSEESDDAEKTNLDPTNHPHDDSGHGAPPHFEKDAKARGKYPLTPSEDQTEHEDAILHEREEIQHEKGKIAENQEEERARAGAAPPDMRSCLGGASPLDGEPIPADEVLIKRGYHWYQLNPRAYGEGKLWLERVCRAEGRPMPETPPEGAIRLNTLDMWMRVSGFVKLDVMYSIGLDPDELFNPEATQNQPYDVLAADTLRMLVWRTRIVTESWTDTNVGQLHTYIAFDFAGGGSFDNGSSLAPRLRQAYATIGRFAIGQMWTNFTGNFVPATVDFTGPVGMVSFRQAQVRYTQPVGKALNWITAFERPLSTGYNGAKSFVPDLSSTLNLSTASTTANISALARGLKYELPGADGLTGGFAFGWGAGLNVSQTIGATLIQAGGVYGRGVGEYLYSGAGTPDGAGIGSAYIDSDTGALVPIEIWGVMGAVQQQIGKFVFNVVYGHLEGYRPKIPYPNAFRRETTFHTNLWFRPTSKFFFGVGYEWAWRELNSGSTRIGQRPEIVGQFDF